jgi:hypothetical protein
VELVEEQVAVEAAAVEDLAVMVETLLVRLALLEDYHF